METTKKITYSEIFEIIRQDDKIIENLKEENNQLKSENQELIKLVNQLVEEHCSLTEMILNGQESNQNIRNFFDKKRFGRMLKEVFENK